MTFAELVGLAQELDTAVMQMVIATLVAVPAVCIAVNVSGMSMQDRRFCDDAVQEVETAALDGRLMIELTETAEIQDVPAAAANMERLRAVGVPLCLDDFGAGAASFGYLRSFAVDLIKIDGSFVRRALDSPRERSFVSLIVDLATSVQAGTVAEMIETEEQARLMEGLGVRLGQGWLFGRPGRLPG